MTSKYFIERFKEDEIIDEIITDSHEYIWDSLTKKIDDNFLATFEIPYAVDMSMQKISKLINIATYSYDGDATEADNPLESMIPDEEPRPNVIDSWARGTGYFFDLFILLSLINFYSGNQKGSC